MNAIVFEREPGGEMVYQHKLGVSTLAFKRIMNGLLAFIFFASIVLTSTALKSHRAEAAALVIKPGGSWYFLNDDTNAADSAGQGSFAGGPNTPPLGYGSAKLTAGPGKYDLLFGTAAHGFPFSDISALSFQTYTVQGDAPSLQIGIDYDGTGGNNDYQGRAVYQPVTSTNSWSSVIDPLTDTNKNWWITDYAPTGTTNPCPSVAPCTWSELTDALPSATVQLGWGFKADKDVVLESISYVDNVTFNATTYDFEPATTTPPIAEQTQELVRPADLKNDANHWTYHDDVKDSTDPLNAASPAATDNHKITDKPDATPGDLGAVRLSAGPSTPKNEKFNLATMLYSGTKLADISELGFDLNTNNPGQAYVNIDINFNSLQHGPGSLHHGRLIYMPNAVANEWGTHKAIKGGTGIWSWSGGNTWPDGATGPRTWSSIVSAFPNAYISSPIKQIIAGTEHFGGVYFRADGDNAVTAYYDNIYLATASKNILYNFEVEPILVTAPTNLRLQVNGSTLACNGTATVNLATALWNPVPNAVSYEYEVTYGGTTVYWATLGTAENTGAFGGGQNGDWSFRVRSVSATGNTSDWSDYCNVVLDTDDPVATISGVGVSEDQQRLSFALTATDSGTGVKHVAANIYNADNEGEALIKLGQNASGGISGTTRLNIPYSGLTAGVRTETWTLNDIDISSLSPGTYTIRAFARDQLNKEHRFATYQFTVTTPPVVNPGEDDEDEEPTQPVSGGGSTSAPVVQPQATIATLAAVPQPFTTFSVGLTDDGTFAAAAQAEATDEGEVAGVSDEDGQVRGASNFLAQNAANQTDGKVFGLFGIAWYWILAALAALSALWWIIAGKRRKQDDNNVNNI